MTVKSNKAYLMLMSRPAGGSGDVVHYDLDAKAFSSHVVRRSSSLVGYASSVSKRAVEGYVLHDSKNGANFSAWVDCIRDLAIDFEEGRGNPVEILGHFGVARSRLWAPVIERFCTAIRDYQDFKSECAHASDMSQESARRLLLMIPIIANRSPRFHVDSTDGCFSVDVGVRGDRVMSLHVGGNGHVNFSYVGQKKRIYKFSGTAKFKDLEDYEEFDRVLRML